ncbi:MAG: SUMF1/EgtB/PvdO family nonheme iron enzyme, partial [Planctomycetota bacterium]
MRWLVLIVLLAPAHAEELLFLRVNDRGAEEWLRIKDGATVIRIPRGEYQRRAYEGKIATQKPKPHFVESFFMDQTEVTNRQFARFLNETNDAKAMRHGIPGIVRAQLNWQVTPGMENHPVTAATGHGALAYAKWVGG